MIDLTGEAVLALWNGVEASRRREYDAWHTREHVPERLTVSGILAARRYVRTGGPLPEYLTLYALETTDVLRSDPYRALLDNPTPWSRAMRPSLRDFLRVPCRRVMSAGGGLGSVAAACVLSQREAASISLGKQLSSLVQLRGIVAVHLLTRDHNIPDVPFQVGGPSPNWPNDGAIFLEGYDAEELSNCTPDVRKVMRGAALHDAEQTLTIYRLAYAIDRASLERAVPIHSAVT
jgi:hypothetical protein